MTAVSLSMRWLQRSLLEPAEGTVNTFQRLRENETFRGYLRERLLNALPLFVMLVVASVTLAVGTAAFATDTNGLIALLVMVTVVPIVLLGSGWVLVHALLSWLEERSLVTLLGGGRSRARGPINQWLARHVHIDLGPAPHVPWIPAVVFVLLPAVVLTQVSATIAEALVALVLAAVFIYAARDRVVVPGQARAKREPAPAARRSGQGEDLDFTAPPRRSRLSEATEQVRSSMAAASQRASFRLRSFGKLVLVNVPPLAEYAALAAGLYLSVSGRQSGSAREPALGVALIGGALMFAGLASIVTRRMSFRFFRRAGSGYAGAIALIWGVMQVIAGGIAIAAAYALANGTWGARLDGLVAHPWPLLIPLGLLVMGAGLLLMHRPYGHFSPLGILLYILPKTLIGAVVFAAGAAILGAWGWKIYDAKAFLSFVHVFLGGNLHYLEQGWSTVIAWLR
jgi:hypothetical protein